MGGVSTTGPGGACRDALPAAAPTPVVSPARSTGSEQADFLAAMREERRELAADQQRRDEARQEELRAIAAGFFNGLNSIAAAAADRRDPSPGRNYHRSGRLAGLEFKQNLPVLKDTDTNFDKHWRQF